MLLDWRRSVLRALDQLCFPGGEKHGSIYSQLMASLKWTSNDNCRQLVGSYKGCDCTQLPIDDLVISTYNSRCITPLLIYTLVLHM